MNSIPVGTPSNRYREREAYPAGRECFRGSRAFKGQSGAF